VAQLTNRAKKDIDDLPEPMQSKVYNVIENVEADPSLGWKLKGKLEGVRSINVGRSHRILFVRGPSGVIVKAVRPRRDVYR
jgi:mRNA-degrading endonuclease RelE of RelBE toxin-antitoxin system